MKDKSMDSMIEEGGANLSGGEKQKIAVTRMLHEKTDVLILDEITSNLDKESAEEILEQTLKYRENKIVFIISHDEKPEKYATQTIYLE